MAGDAKHVANIYWRFDKKRKGYLTEAEFCESLKGLNNVEPPADALVEICFPKKGLKKKGYGYDQELSALFYLYAEPMTLTF